MNISEELVEDGDTSDDDYVPDKKTEVLSEVESDGDPEDSLSEGEDEQKGGKRRKTSKKPRKKLKKSENDSDKSVLVSKQPNEEEKKKLEEDIWADFMKDTGFQSRKSINKVVSTTNKNGSTSSSKNDKEKPNKPQEKVKITKIFEFAGEEVTVEKEVPADSAEARLLSTQQNTQSKSSRSKGGLSGISGILSQLGRKPKISTLEKSKLDWDKFKKEENLEEELQSHNKGKDGYLEKQDFLQRADLRRFEIEKEVRTVERNRRINNS